MQVGVSLVLSFMVVWDFPTIARGMQSLRSSRLRAVYTEVAPTFTVFGSLFGKALQAQVALNARIYDALTATKFLPALSPAFAVVLGSMSC